MAEQTQEITVEGYAADGYEGVREAFLRNFTEHGDQGASCAIYVDGEPVVDLWGGVADVATGCPWEQDTLVLVYSATKGATAILCHLLAARGELDLDAPVASYWPEFAAGGKARITVRQILSHRAGLPVIDARLSLEELLDGRKILESLAVQSPEWEPGSAHGYHALTYGWLLGEIVRRATGTALGTLFAREVAGPLGLDLFIGLPGAEQSRVAALVDGAPPDPSAIDAITDPAAKAMVLAMVGAMMDPSSLMARALSNNGALATPGAAGWNDPRVHAAEMPAANAITNARSLARMYAACVGEVDGIRLLDDATLAAAAREQSNGADRVLLAPSRFSSGFMLHSPMTGMLGESSFGHTGAGGAFAWGDREARVGFGYAQNQLGGGLTGEPRTEGLVRALRSALEHRGGR